MPGYIPADKMAFFIQGLVRLSHMVIVLFIRRHIDNFLRYHRIRRITMVNPAVRRLNKSILINPCISRKGIDQTNVRTFRGLNRAHSSVM